MENLRISVNNIYKTTVGDTQKDDVLDEKLSVDVEKDITNSKDPLEYLGKSLLLKPKYTTTAQNHHFDSIELTPQKLAEKINKIQPTDSNLEEKFAKGAKVILEEINNKNLNVSDVNTVIEKGNPEKVISLIGQYKARYADVPVADILNLITNKKISSGLLDGMLESSFACIHPDLFLKYYDVIDNLQKLGMEFIDIPQFVSNIEKEYTKDTVDKILTKLNTLKKEYEFSELSLNDKDADDLHIRLRADSVCVFKFDKNSGELTAVNERGTIYNQKNGTVAESKFYSITENGDKNIPVYKEFWVKSKTGETILEEQLVRGDVDGEMEIYSIDSSGKQYKIGLAEFGNDGSKYVEKNLTSLDRTKTTYVYSEDAEGNNYLYYSIKDKDGKELYKSEKKHKVLDQNHYQTTNNGQSFDIEILKDKLVVTKLDKNNKKTNEMTEFKIVDISQEQYSDVHKCMATDYNNREEAFGDIERILGGKNIVDRFLVPGLKKLSGIDWFLLSKQTPFVFRNFINDNNSGSANGIILICDEHFDNATAFGHEIGHEKFCYLNLAGDNELKRIYEEEKALFTSTFSDRDIKVISYFLEDNNIDSRGLSELCAETNQIINYTQTFSRIQARNVALQQFFPRTIAYIANKFDNTI